MLDLSHRLASTHDSPRPRSSFRARRERMIFGLDPWAHTIARQYMTAERELDDLHQVARLGAIKAVDRYDPRRGELLAYALPLMRGEVRHHLRSTWSVHLPRELQEVCVGLPRLEGTLEQQLQRAPNDAELARFAGMPEGAIRGARAARHAVRTVSWDASPGDPTGAPLSDRTGAPDPHYDELLDAAFIDAAVRQLHGAERTAVTLTYFEGWSQREIGERLGCSQMQVSRLLARALVQLRAYAADASAALAACP